MRKFIGNRDDIEASEIAREEAIRRISSIINLHSIRAEELFDLSVATPRSDSAKQVPDDIRRFDPFFDAW